MGLLYIEKGVNKPQKWLPRLSELLECTPEQLMGLEPIDGIDTPPEIEFKEKYVEYSIEIIGNLVEAEDLTKEGRAKLISDVYRLVYDYFEYGKDQKYFEDLLAELKNKSIITNSVLEFVKKFNKNND